MMKKCTRCKWHNNGYDINCTGYFGNSNADIVFVGEAFGLSEAKAKEAFVGSSGEKLNEYLRIAGLDRKDVAIMNAMRCYQEGNPTPTKKEIDTCFVYTYNDIQKINPRLIVALGASAFYCLTGKAELGPYLGRVIYSERINRNVFLTYHPAAALYDHSKKQIIEDHFRMIPDIIDKKIEDKKFYEGIVIDSVDKLNYYLKDKNFETEVGFDIETNNKVNPDLSLNPYDNNSYINLLQIGFSEEEIYVIEKEVLDKRPKILYELFESGWFIGHGFEFDAKYLYIKFGIFPKSWYFDTCISEFVISGMKDNDLNTCVGKYNKEYYGYWEEVKKFGGAHKIRDRKELYKYAASDVGTLFPIYKRQTKQLCAEGQYNVFMNIIMPTNKILTEMSLHGVKFDVDRLMEVDKYYKDEANKLLNKALKLPAIQACEEHFKRKFNARSSQMVHWILLKYYNLPVIKTNKSGKPTIGMDEMKKYAEKYKNPYCKLMENYRSYQTLRDNFLSGAIPKLVDGVAHTKYSLHATNSGRPNSKDPNLLNYPHLKDVKRCVVAREGCSFVYADFAQLEVRIGAVVYNEPRLINICNDPTKDMHCAITAQAFGRDYDEIYNGYKNGDEEITELRRKGKTLAFGIIYGMGPQALSYELNISEEEAKEFIDKFYDNFPDMSKNMEDTRKLLIKQGYLDNYFGFRRRWKSHSEEDHGTLREGINHLVQSLAFNILELSLIEIDKRIEKENLKSKLIMQVYDSIVVESLDEEIPVVSEIIRDVMGNINKPYEGINRVVLKADVEVGKNLADLEKYK